MHYCSTRGDQTKYTSYEAIKQGLALDEGLFVPSEFPMITLDQMKLFAKMDYGTRAAQLLSKFLTDYSYDELKSITEKAYNKKTFETQNIAPVYKFTANEYFLELWHGPTCAFKDMALQVLPHLLTRAMEKSCDKRQVLILTATSGDTGKAALEGFRDVPGTKIAVFYPENGVSKIQRLQMVTQEGENVAVSAVKGNFDDAQTGVKQIFSDREYVKEFDRKGYILSSANSINLGRLVPQIAYYFSAYCDLLNNDEISLGEKINFVVPTGNFGNILSAYYAKLMGLPVARLICASNKNDVLTEFIKTGCYNAKREFFTTASPSMDILVSSNLERLLYDMSERDANAVSIFMNSLKNEGTYTVSEDILYQIKQLFWAGSCDDADTLETIRDTFDESGYVMDPHTAVAKNVYDQYKTQTGDRTKTVIVSTASPFKFARFVGEALGAQVFGEMGEFAILQELSRQIGMKIPASLEQLQGKKVRFEHLAEINGMREFVDSVLV